MSKTKAAWLLPLVCASAFGPARAQQNPGDAAPLPAAAPDSAGSGAQLAEVIVTATKRATGVREIPGSVTALRGSDLEQHGYQGQEDFLKLVPGVTFYNDGINANRVTIRGIGADLNTSNTTGVFIGDVPFEDPVLPRVTLDPNLYDLARVEVLKGPQGTLFGGAALNGAVRYVPNEPLLREWEEKAFYEIQQVDGGGIGPLFGGALNIPVGQSAALRVVGFDRRSPGWVDDLTRGLPNVNQTLQSGGRVMGVWQPGERWKISGMGIVQRTFLRDTAITDNRDGVQSRDDTPLASPTHTRYDLETLGVQYSFDSFDVLSQTSRTRKAFDTVQDVSRIANLPEPTLPLLTTVNDNRSQSFMQELRFTSNSDWNPDWKWLGGAFYRRVRMTESTNMVVNDVTLPLPSSLITGLSQVIPGLGGFITPDGQLNLVQGNVEPDVASEYALFGETTATFWHRLEVTLGLRAFRTTSEAEVIFAGPLAISKILATGSTAAVQYGALTSHGLNPKFALRYKFTPQISAYASVSRGFRFGGPQVLVGTLFTQTPPVYKSDTLWAYEIGLRTEWLNKTLIADITPYQINWLNPQLQQADQTGLGAFFSNVGGARARGVELSLSYLPPILKGLSLSFSGSYDSTVTTVPFTTSSGVDTQPGTRWPLSSRWQSVTTVGYAHRLFGNWKGGGSLVYSFIGPAPNTLAYLDEVFGYQTLDAMLKIDNSYLPGTPELTLSLNNATNTHGVISGENNPQFARDHVYIRPRTLIARFAVNF